MNSIIMKNLQIIFRTISKQISLTFINVGGLAVGLAASLLILMWVLDEINYDKSNKNASDIYLVAQDQFYKGERYRVSVTPFACGPVFKQRIPEIKEEVRFVRCPKRLFRSGEKVFYENSVRAVDPSIFSVFTIPLLTGNSLTALNDPHSIVLSEKLASKYFGKENPLGKVLMLENRTPFTVTAVMKDIPENSTTRASAMIPFSFLREDGVNVDNWNSNEIYTFIHLQKGADPGAVAKKLTAIMREHNPESIAKYFPFPLLDLHLHAQWGYVKGPGNITNVYIFTAIAIFVILIACINFINLATARSETRGKEIGIKKIAGASRFSMIMQFMTETMVVVMIALFIALILVVLSLGLFNTIAAKHFTLTDIFQFKFIAGFVIIGIITGFLAGIYPAFYLSSLKPVLVLKGETVKGRRNGRLRKMLVVVQFSLSMFIALGAIFMYLQLKYMQEKELGFDKENLICIPMSDNIKKKYYSLKVELQKESLIAGVTGATWNPTNISSNSGGAEWEGKDPQQNVLIGVNAVDYDYLETMKMKLVSGRGFSRDFTGDMARDSTGNFLINEEVAKLMGGGDVVGKSLNFQVRGKIVGVMKNFHFEGAGQPILPMAFNLTDTTFLNVILVRLAAGNLPASIKALEKTWRRVIPDYPLEYTFVENDYDALYRSEMRMSLLLKYFTILAVIIACLGLYGLSAYAASRRSREIGVRKAMGADIFSIIYALSKEFLLLVIIAIIISFPLGWYYVDKMLKGFAYRIEMSALVFAAIGLGALVIALITVSFQAYRAASVSPSLALKSE